MILTNFYFLLFIFGLCLLSEYRKQRGRNIFYEDDSLIVISNCFNCNKEYEGPKDNDGLYLVDDRELKSYLCNRCRSNPSLKESDYMTIISCLTEKCDVKITIAKKYSNNKIYCPLCLGKSSKYLYSSIKK